MALSPYTSPPNASADNTTDEGSNGGLLVGLTFFTRTAPRAKAVSAIGSTSQNIHRQSKALRMTPEIVGPTAGATAMTIEIMPIIFPRALAGTRFSTVFVRSGIINAVPLA